MLKKSIAALLSALCLTSCNMDNKTDRETPEWMFVSSYSANNSDKEKKLFELNGFRKYKLNSPVSNYPELVRLPEEDIPIGETGLTTKCYYKIDEDLAFSDLTANKIRYYFFNDKLTVVTIAINKYDSAEFLSTINTMFNPYHQLDVTKDDYNFELIKNFQNEVLEIIYQEGSNYNDNDFIHYKSLKQSKKIEEAIKKHKDKVLEDRQANF